MRACVGACVRVGGGEDSMECSVCALLRLGEESGACVCEVSMCVCVDTSGWQVERGKKKLLLSDDVSLHKFSHTVGSRKPP